MPFLAVNFFADVLPAFAIVFGAPVAIWWYMRRSRGSGVTRLRISDKAVLGKNVWVAVVEIDDKRFLVGAGESGANLISELEALPEVAEEPVEEAAEEPLAGQANLSNGITEQPRTGLVRRLQLMTVRGTAQTPWRSFGGSRR